MVKNCQILCDVNQTDEAMKIINSHSKKEAINKLFDSIQNGNLKYINAEANINVSPLFNEYINKKNKENYTITPNQIAKISVYTHIAKKIGQKKLLIKKFMRKHIKKK